MSEPASVPPPRAPRTPPRSVAGVSYVGALLAVGLVALGVAGVQHLAVQQGWASGRSWLLAGLDAVDGLGPSAGLAFAGGGAAFVGLLLVIVSLKPGRRSHLRTTVDVDLWLSHAAVRELARHRADRLPGVAAVRDVRLRRNRLRLDVAAQRDADDVQQRVSDDVGPPLERLVGVRTVVRASAEAAS